MSLLSFFTPKTLEVTYSTVNGEIKVVENFGKRTLYVGGVEQSGGTIVPMWEEAFSKIRNSMPLVWRAKFEIRNCLVLGVGGATVIKILKSNWPQAKITGIEVDPVMVKIAQKYFSLGKYSDLKIVVGNAASWVRKIKKRNSFDLIIVDLFVGKLNPRFARRASFLSDLKDILGRPGFILYNSHFQEDKSSEFDEFLKTCKKLYVQLKVIVKYRYSRILLLGTSFAVCHPRARSLSSSGLTRGSTP